MAKHVPAERVTVVRCRSWPIVGAGHRLDDLAAVVAANRVVATSATAEQVGVSVGMRRREAQRLAPGLAVLSPDLAAEARLFEPVLRALDDLTPRIEIGEHGMCSFLTRGPSRYFGGDEAMSARVASTVADVLEDRTSVHVGTADGRFAAIRASSLAEPGQARVVVAETSAAFLSPLPIELLSADVAISSLRRAFDDLVGVLARLGLVTLGAFAELDPADVVARFGATGRRAHLWACGGDDRPMVTGDPPADLVVAWDLDPVIERVDQAAFVARSLAEAFIAGLRDRGANCARVEIHAETEHGETQTRLWRSDEAFAASAIAERMRWQLDGWLSGPVRQRPTGGLARLMLRPDDLSIAAGRQLGFWGEETGRAERAARSVARVQGLIGVGAVFVPEVSGGRRPIDAVSAIPVESVDLVERATAVDRTLIGGETVGAVAGVQGQHGALPWPGQLPRPAPAMLHRPPTPVSLVDVDGREVNIDGRGLMLRPPSRLHAEGRPPLSLVGWSGPWLLDERWWQPEHRRRSARIQVVADTGQAFVVATRSGSWVIEASYD